VKLAKPKRRSKGGNPTEGGTEKGGRSLKRSTRGVARWGRGGGAGKKETVVGSSKEKKKQIQRDAVSMKKHWYQREPTKKTTWLGKVSTNGDQGPYGKS